MPGLGTDRRSDGQSRALTRAAYGGSDPSSPARPGAAVDGDEDELFPPFHGRSVYVTHSYGSRGGALYVWTFSTFPAWRPL
jgi:hypothetical protein